MLNWLSEEPKKNKSRKSKRLQRQQLFVQAFENNLNTIVGYLDNSSINNLKLTCRIVNYIFVSQEIWIGMKSHLAEVKLDNYEDVEYVQEDPKPQTKEDRKIRIHSLKKPHNNTQKRQSSNLKHKLNTINTYNHQMVFRTTEIGFKRLLKTNNLKHRPLESNHQSILDIIQLPQSITDQEIIIKVQDPWAINMHRVGTLISIVKKWNQFHSKLNKILTQRKQFVGFVKVIGWLEDCQVILNGYSNTFKKGIYMKIVESLEGAENNLLIDEQLNKVGKLFLKFHKQIVVINGSCELFLQKIKKLCEKIDKSVNGEREQSESASTIAENLNNIDDGVTILMTLSKQTPQLFDKIKGNLMNIIQKVLQIQQISKVQGVILSKISFSNLARNPYQYEIILQILSSIYSKLLKIVGEQDFGLNLLKGKWKSIKIVINNLWNITKYFGKIKKQIEIKKRTEKANIIEQFIQYYSNYKCEFEIMNYRNAGRLQKQMNSFKERIAKLKQEIQENE